MTISALTSRMVLCSYCLSSARIMPSIEIHKCVFNWIIQNLCPSGDLQWIRIARYLVPSLKWAWPPQHRIPGDPMRSCHIRSEKWERREQKRWSIINFKVPKWTAEGDCDCPGVLGYGSHWGTTGLVNPLHTRATSWKSFRGSTHTSTSLILICKSYNLIFWGTFLFHKSS